MTVNTLQSTYKEERLRFFIDEINQIKKEIEAKHIHGKHQEWKDTIAQLLKYPSSGYSVTEAYVSIFPDQKLNAEDSDHIRSLLMDFHPWRKGPFSILGIPIQTEWQSDWKWERIKNAVEWRGRSVLDVGCGSGYHCWRMWGAKARSVLGIDPTRLSGQQFKVLKSFIPQAPIHFLPFRLEDFPDKTYNFDVVCSMGVLYHCKSPFVHLEQLRGALRKGGTLLLETLIIEGPINTVLVPENRYAQMRNVWCIPTVDTLCLWLKRMGLINPQVIDVTPTTTQEQKTTEWMTFHSLKDYLQPDDHRQTIEGYPAPIRAVITAQRP